MRLWLILTFTIGLVPSLALAESRFTNLESYIRELNFGPLYRRQQNAKPIKIAVLDNGFKDWKKSKFLPANVKYHSPIVSISQEETHGLIMAELLYAMLTDSGLNQQYIPSELHLFPTYGYSNFKAAVEGAIAAKVNLILYAQTWDFGGNFDGTGFINALVDKATAAGIIWVNAAGNNRGLTFNAKIPPDERVIKAKCLNENNCRARIALAWNAFPNNTGEGTDKDLDLIVKQNGKVVATAALKQKSSGPVSINESLYSREIANAELVKGEFSIFVKNNSKNFSRTDRMRVTLSGDFLALDDSDENESIAPPADNANVITIGAIDANRSSFSSKRTKPDLWTKSLVKLDDGNTFQGSSTASAIAAAGIGILLSNQHDLSKNKLIEFLGSNDANQMEDGTPGKGLKMEILGFTPASGNCFQPVKDEYLPKTKYVKNALRLGGKAVATSAGVKILFANDPQELLERVKRIRFDDILIIGPAGSGVYPRHMLYQLHPEFIELAQVPRGQRICTAADPERPMFPGKVFLMPAKIR